MRRTRALFGVVEHADVAVIGLDARGCVLCWNRCAERLYDGMRWQALGQPLLDFVPLDAREETRSALAGVLAGAGMPARLPLPVLMTAHPVRDEAGGIVGAILIGSGPRAREQSFQGLETFVAGIAHQFNNINSSVQGLLELVLMESGTSDCTRDHVAAALASLHRASEITRRLLLVGTRIPPPTEGLRLDRILALLMPFMVKDLEDRGIEVSLDLGESPPVLASPLHINLLLTELVENAAHATLGCGEHRVTVKCGVRGKIAFFEVGDTGCGIAPGDLPRLFSPFFTTKGEFATPGSPQSAVRGVGLGLSLCQRIVNDLGGRIEVESSPGLGARFRVSFQPASTAGV
jgi:signal transduction histidine kinase